MRYDVRAIGVSLGATIMSSCIAVPDLVSESSLASRFKRASRRLRARAIVLGRRRSLIGEILALQLIVAAVVGALAFGGLVYETRGIPKALAIGIVVMVLLTAASWVISRRALLARSALQGLLERLAHGQTDLSVTASGYREIAAVANALKARASVLDEREQRLSQLESRDGLTGLLNRSSFQALLARRDGIRCGVGPYQRAVVRRPRPVQVRQRLGRGGGRRPAAEGRRRLVPRRACDPATSSRASAATSSACCCAKSRTRKPRRSAPIS